METPSEHELKLREARVQGAEQAVQALKDATLELERRAAQFATDIRRLEDGQARLLRWTVGAILALGLILGGAGIALLLDQGEERRALDLRLSGQLDAIRARADTLAGDVAATAEQARLTGQAATRGGEAADALLAAVAELAQGLDDTNRRADLMLGRLAASIDNIRADFSYLVEGGGYRSSFAGQVVIAVPYESADADRAGTFLSDIDVSLLSAGGQLRAGTLRLVVPRHGRIPQQRASYTLTPQFMTALADLVGVEDGNGLRRIADADDLLTAFHELEVWPALAQATLDGRLNDFLIDAQPTAAE